MTNVQSEDGDIGFQIAPMVDIVFVLMLFFMASAALQTEEAGFTISPSRSGHGEIIPYTILVDISPEGQVVINGMLMDNPSDTSLPELRAWFGRLRQDFGKIDPVILRPSSETVHSDVVKVLDAMAVAGVVDFSFN